MNIKEGKFGLQSGLSPFVHIEMDAEQYILQCFHLVLSGLENDIQVWYYIQDFHRKQVDATLSMFLSSVAD